MYRITGCDERSRGESLVESRKSVGKKGSGTEGGSGNWPCSRDFDYGFVAVALGTGHEKISMWLHNVAVQVG